MTGPTLDLLFDGDPIRAQARALVADWQLERLDGVQAVPPGFDVAVWSAAYDLISSQPDWISAGIPVLEELCYAGCPTPVHNRLVARAALLDGLRLDLPPAIAAEPLAWAAALPAARRDAAQLMLRKAGGYLLTGAIGDVMYGDSLGGLLIVATGPDGEPAVVAVPVAAAGVGVVTHATLSANRLTDFTFDSVLVDALLAGGAGAGSTVATAVETARLAGLVGLGAELIGRSAALLTATVERVTSRSAFGSTVAALPTVQQRVADMHLDFVAAQGAVQETASGVAALGGRTPTATFVAQVSAMKLTTSDAALRIAAGAHQLCGGWGQLWETGLHHHTRAIKAAEGQLGRPDEHAATIAAVLAATSAAGSRGF